MPPDRAAALVVRTMDWSESSRIAVLWSREFGKLRVLAKGGRRLKSNFESAIDLLNVCNVVVIRKPTTELDLLTEAQVSERFPKLPKSLPALYSAYYIAELLAEGTQDDDPHPLLYDASLAALRELGDAGEKTGPRLAAYELTWLHELGYSPALDACAACGRSAGSRPMFSASAGGIICSQCAPFQREKRSVRPTTLDMMRELQLGSDGWRKDWGQSTKTELRQVLGQYITYRLGKRLRTLKYVPQ